MLGTTTLAELQLFANSASKMSKLVQFVSTLIKWSMFGRINMFRYHWAAYVGHLEGEEGIESRFYYLGIGFILNTIGLLISAINIVGVFKKHHWLEDPCYRIVMFVNYFPEQIRNTEAVIWFCYFLAAVLGLGYELHRRERAPTFMRIYTPRGEAALGKDEYRTKFKRFQRYCMLMTYMSTYSFYFFLMSSATIYVYIESYWINPTFYVFWVVLIVLQTSSGTYIAITVPFLLIISTYYLQLLQRMLLNNMQAIMKNKGTQNRTALLRNYEQMIGRYASANQLLSEFNKFWSFYLYIWIQLYPVMLTYLIYTMVNHSIESIMWFALYVITIVVFTSNLLVVVYVSTEVSKKNGKLAQSIVNIFRHNLQVSLTGDLRRHLHLQGAVDQVRLTKYYLRSISNQIIDRKTYFLLFFKFAFIYLKLTNLAKNNLKSTNN